MCLLVDAVFHFTYACDEVSRLQHFIQFWLHVLPRLNGLTPRQPRVALLVRVRPHSHHAGPSPGPSSSSSPSSRARDARRCACADSFTACCFRQVHRLPVPLLTTQSPPRSASLTPLSLSLSLSTRLRLDSLRKSKIEETNHLVRILEDLFSRASSNEI